MRITVLALVALAACGEGPPPASSAPETGGDVALKSAAELKCAQITGYAPEKLQTQTSEMQALVTREYNSCVARVVAGN